MPACSTPSRSIQQTFSRFSRQSHSLFATAIAALLVVCFLQLTSPMVRAQLLVPPLTEYARIKFLPTPTGVANAISTIDLGPTFESDEVAVVTSNNQLYIYPNGDLRYFLPPRTYATGPNPVAISSGNFRGSGQQEVIVAQAGNNTIRTWISNYNGTLGAYHDYPCDGLVPREILAVDGYGIFIANSDRITFLQTRNNFGTSDPAAIFYPATPLNLEPNARDLAYIDFDGQSIELADIPGSFRFYSNGEDLCYVSEDNKVVVTKDNVTMRIPIAEPIGRMVAIDYFLCLYLPQSNRLMRLSFGGTPGVGQTIQLSREHPSGRSLLETLTYNYTDLPPGTTDISAQYVNANETNLTKDLIINTPSSNSITVYLDPAPSGPLVPLVVPMRTGIAKLATGTCDWVDSNYDIAVVTTDGRVGIAFSNRPPIIVNTAVDEDNGTADLRVGTGTSLREAVNWATELQDRTTILLLNDVDVSAFAENDPVLGKSAFVITTEVTIQPPPVTGRYGSSAGGKTIRRATGAPEMRLFRVAAGGKLTLSDAIVRNWSIASTSQTGAGIYSSGDVVVDRCTFRQNTTTVGGSAIGMDAGTLSVTNATFAESTGYFRLLGGTATLTHVTAASTSSTVAPLYVRNANVTLINSLITGYTGTGIDGTLTAASRNNVVAPSVSNVGTLDNYGGYTPTIQLLPGSPAINAGAPVVGVNTDQRGYARGDGFPDAGAFEFSGFVESLVVTTDVDENNGTSDVRYGTGTSLREALAYANAKPGYDFITFSPQVFNVPRTILLTLGVLNLSSGIGDVEINGPSSGLTIDGNNASRIFTMALGSGATLRYLTLTRGFSGSAFASAGGAIFNSGFLTLEHCTLHSNAAHFAGYGGAIKSSANLTLTNCTFANNSAGGAAAIDCSGSDVFTHITVTQNTATFGVGGIRTSASVQLFNSIVTGNADSNGTSSNIDGNVSLFGGFLVGALNPKLGTLANNGGPTPTVALLAGSPAVGAGDPEFSPATDQRGIARDGSPDLGAYELVGVQESLVVSTITDETDGTSDPRFGTGTSLREAIAYAVKLGGPQTITFAPALAGQNVQLQRGVDSTNSLVISSPITIRGPASGAGVTLQSLQSFGSRRQFLVNAGSSLTLENLTLRGSRGPGAGASVFSSGQLTVKNCTFTDNITSQDGGAIYSAAGAGTALAITNSTFAGNSATGEGAAIAAHASACSLQHVTIVDNVSGFGAALSSRCAALLLKNTLVARNTLQNAAEGNLVFGSGGALDPASTSNLFGPGSAVSGGSGSILNVASAQLYVGTLASNGGPTPTIALLPGSPALNAGTVLAGLTTDQRGNARIVGAAPDIGAIEDAGGGNDSDGDGITNIQEQQIGTNPLAIDSDGDGFNDATEILSGSDPKLATNTPGATHVERVLGFGTARGLDLTGNFKYAFNVGTPGAAGQAGDANFTSDNVPGVTVTAANEIANWTTREFGSGTGDNAIETVLRSMRRADNANSNPTLRSLKVDLANLVPGRRYKLQLLFAEAGSSDRTFDVFVDSALVVAGFNTNTAQGNITAASAIVYEVTATNSTLRIELSGLNTPGTADHNPILNGATLEILPTALEGWRTLHSLAANGSGDLANPSRDGVANLLKFAFNMAPNSGGLTSPDSAVLPANGAAGLPFITRDAQGRLFIEFIRRKAATNPGISYLVETGDALANLLPLDLAGATIQSIDASWERVTVVDSAITPQCFGRVRVSILP